MRATRRRLSVSGSKGTAPERDEVSPPDLYKQQRWGLVVLAVIVVLAALVVLLLVSAGDDAPDEAPGDLTYIEGSVPERQGQGNLVASIADITAADVFEEESALVFRSTVAAPPPQPLKTSALEFRWDISGEDGTAWTLSVAVAKEAHASLFSQGGYGSGTVDGTFPGELSIDEDTVTVRLDAAEVEAFPESFEWSLSTTLRAFRKETDSPRVEDRYPDDGSESFDG